MPSTYAIAETLGAHDPAAKADIARFMTHAVQDMQEIMDSFGHDLDLMHSSAMIAAARAFRAKDYKTINEQIAMALDASGMQGHTIREKIYHAIEVDLFSKL